MLVHFIGGPRDGEREALQTINDRIMFPVAPTVRYAPGVADLLAPNVQTAEYRVTRRKRYAIAEYVEPRITTRWSVSLKVADSYDYDTLEAFRRFLIEREVMVSGDVRWTSAQVVYGDEATLEFSVSVEGPPDPGAIAAAAEKLQHWLDKNVPAGVSVVSVSAAAETDD